MDEIFETHLKDLINIKPHKKVEGTNKKVISTCIFMPEKPSINEKTTLYVPELVKLVETFHKFDISKDWILRVYFDEMYFTGLTKKVEEQLVEVANNGINNAVNKPPSNNANPALNNANDYTYQYNSIEDKGDNTENIRNIKTSIKQHKDFMKKMLKLIHIFIKHILSHKEEDKYKHIEVYTYNCPLVQTPPEFIGHPSIFGTIIRFMPLFDSDVDMTFCINGRYPINSIINKLIDEWGKMEQKKLFAYSYNAPFIQNSFNEFEELLDMAKKDKDSPLEKYVLLKESIDAIFKIKHSLFESHTKKSYEDIKTKKETKKDAKAMMVPDRNGGTRNLRTSVIKRASPIYHLLSPDIEATHVYAPSISSMWFSIAAGLFGIKRDCPHYNDRILSFAKLLSYYIKSKNQFIFGIDEFIIIMILALEIIPHDYNEGKIVWDDKTNEIDYILHIHENYDENTDKEKCQCPNVFRINQSKMRYLYNSKGDQLKLCANLVSDMEWDINTYIIVGLYTTKILWTQKGGVCLHKHYNDLSPITRALEMEQITETLCTNGDKLEDLILNFHTLFNYYDEYRKLYIVKKNTKLYNIVNAKSNFYTLIIIDDVSLSNINKILEQMIGHFAKTMPTKLVLRGTNKPEPESNNSSNNDIYGGGLFFKNKESNKAKKNTKRNNKKNSKRNNKSKTNTKAKTNNKGSKTRKYKSKLITNKH